MLERSDLIRWILVFVPAIAACGKTPSAFCDEWARETCAVMAHCCRDRTFGSGTCEDALRSECAHDLPPVITIDEDAARGCVGTLDSCSDIGRTPADLNARRKACAALGGGYLGAGSDCENHSECATQGDFSLCWHGVDDMLPSGRCTAVYLDEKTCAYDRAHDVLQLCPDDSFCTLPGFQIGGAPPEDESAWSAPCQPRIAEGKSCIDPNSDDALLACQVGLYCRVVGSNEGTCAKLEPLGASCDGAFGVNECEDGFTCEPYGDTGQRRCLTANVEVPFCKKPALCGDGVCEDAERGVCAQDCGTCGNGICEPAESVLSCNQDCGPGASCFACACKFTTGQFGCRDFCDAALNGIINFCNGVPALPQCAQCIQNMCGDPANCTD